MPRGKGRASFGVVLALAWLLQLANLWPLPSETAANIAASATPQDAGAIAQYTRDLWLGWGTRALMIPLGMLAALMMLNNQRRWPVAVAVVSVAALVLFRVWQWWDIVYAPLFGAFALDRAAWLAMRPLFLFDTLVFPLILVIAVLYAAAHARRTHED